MALTLQEYNDIKALVETVIDPLENISLQLDAIRRLLGSVADEGITITTTIKLGGPDD